MVVAARLWSTGSAAAAHGLSGTRRTWDLPRPGIEPMSLALAGRFFTTVSPGKLPGDSCIVIEVRDNGTLQHRGCKRGGEKLWNFRNILKVQITGFHSG